jgi:excisionase family DNA binding protein
MTTTTDTPTPALLLPSEVAARFRVDPKTVTRWANAGKLPSIRTLGGHRCYPGDAVNELLRQQEGQPATADTEGRR